MSYVSSASKGTFRVEGLKECLASMKGFKDELKEKLVVQASFRAAERMRQAAQDKAPEDEGRLKILIGRITRRSKDGLMATVLIGLLRINRTLAKQGITNDAYYGMFVELGTEFQKAQPFLRPAFDEEKEKYTVQMTEELRALIERARRRAAKR